MKACFCRMLRSTGRWICFALILACTSGAYAMDWPTRPVKMLVPYPPGGSTDILTRLLAHSLTESLKQPVVVENRGGANGSVGTASFAKAGFDDHYFLISNQSTLAINQYLYKGKIGYDPVADLVPVGRYVQTSNAIACNLSVPAKTLKELIDYAKANPGKVSYSSSGIGSTGHLLNEQLKMLTGADILHVPYQGNGPAMQALLAGHVQFNSENIPQLLNQIRAGKLRPLAVTSATRWFQLPDVPTVTEAGFPMLTMSAWFGVTAQTKMPQEVVNKMNQAIVALLKKPDFVAKLREQGLEPTPSTPAEYFAFAKTERERWKAVIDASGATATN